MFSVVCAHFQDVLKFTFIFALFVLAFFVGLHNLYWFYNDDVLSYTAIPTVTHPLTAPAVAAFGR